MKRIGVAGLIRSTIHTNHFLLGRRGKDPNRGLFVLPGGGVEDGESLEEAFRREIKEETGLEVIADPDRWNHPRLIELPDRVILIGRGLVDLEDDTPTAGSDLYDVGWYDYYELPPDMSPVVKPLLEYYMYRFREAAPWV